MKATAKMLLLVVPWAILLCFGALRLWSDLFSFPWVWEEKSRVAAPAGGCELVTYEGNRGAMSSYAYVSFLVKPGAAMNPNACDFYEPVLSSSRVSPAARWESDRRLVLSTGSGHVRHLRPYAREFDVSVVVEGAVGTR